MQNKENYILAINIREELVGAEANVHLNKHTGFFKHKRTTYIVHILICRVLLELWVIELEDTV